MNGFKHIFVMLAGLCCALGASAQEQELSYDNAATGYKALTLYSPRLLQADNRYSYVRGSLRNDTKVAGEGVLSFKDQDMPALGFLVTGNVDGYLSRIDLNEDGYMDEPKHFCAQLGTHWQYDPSFGMKIHFGVRGALDNRLGGQMGEDDVLPVIFARDKVRGYAKDGLWLAGIADRSADAYVDFFYPFGLDGSTSISASADYSYTWTNSTFGNENMLPQLCNIYYGNYSTVSPNPLCRIFDTDRHAVKLEGRLDKKISERLAWNVGADAILNSWRDAYCSTYGTQDTGTGDFGAWMGAGIKSRNLSTFAAEAKLQACNFSNEGLKLAPSISLSWNPAKRLTLDGSFCRDLRRASPMMENLGILASSKTISGDHYCEHPVEDSWVVKAGGTWNIRTKGKRLNYWKIDASYRNYSERAFTDYDLAANTIALQMLSDLDPSEAHYSVASVQWMHHYNPLKSITIELLTRYSYTLQGFEGRGVSQRPLSEGFSHVSDLCWSPGKGKWKFQLVNTVHGARKVWAFMQDDDNYKYGKTPVYTITDIRVARKANGYEFFVDAANVGGFQQEDYINGDNPFGKGFDASCIWGPTCGLRLAIGLRLDLMYK